MTNLASERPVRPTGSKVLLEVEPADFQAGEDGLSARMVNGLYIPKKLASADTAVPGKVLDLGPQAFADKDMRNFLLTKHPIVLFNKYACRVLDNISPYLVVSSDADILGALQDGFYYPYRDIVQLAPLPDCEEVTEAGIILTESYRKYLNGGIDPDTMLVNQFGVARVSQVGPDVTMVGENDWVLFEYRQATYYQNPNRGNLEDVLVRERVILAGAPESLILREYGEKAVLLCR